MSKISGKGVSRGVAVGPVCFFRRADMRVSRITAEPDAEAVRLDEARFAVIRQLEELAAACKNESEEASLLFQTHAMFVEDEDFTACIYSLLEMERCNAEYAVEQAGEQFAAMFAAMDDPYMRERAADVRDVTCHLLNALTGTHSDRAQPEAPAILCADDFTPSETMGLDRSNLLGFITRAGSENSHTAILARSMGIPAVCAVGTELTEEYTGHMCCMDGTTGEIFMDPDASILAEWTEKAETQSAQKSLLEDMRNQEDVAPDGRRISLFCNIGSPEELPAVLDCGAGVIGLFRSEFLFLGRGSLPGEEEQFQSYRAAAAAMDGKQVIIRTLDIGADKQAECLALKREENPALGMRGIRLCLERPELFETQLRAIYRASAYGNVAIMFPMVTSVWEVLACRQACEKVMEQLETEGIPFDRKTKLGIMIETPAAVWMAEELAKEADFFSVGTNDLTQYTLACDRQAGHLSRFSDPCHPAVLRSLKTVAEAAHAAGIPVGICGELAAEAALLPLFLELGIDELSVSPSRLLSLRAALRGVNL